MARIISCAIAVVYVLSVLIKSADSRKCNPGSCSLSSQQITCGSFFYNSQVNNDQGWKRVPEDCVNSVGEYMEGAQFQADSFGVSAAAETFLTSITPGSGAGDGKDVVVFDVDETALSNLPYYREHKYGGEEFNSTTFNLWVDQGTAPAVTAILQLFNALRAARFGVVFLTGRSESQRDITVANLYRAGYKNWTQLILKSPDESGTTAVVYKSKKRTELAANGYEIYSSVGDQWSDVTGPYVGNRTFKVPNPMYYIA